MLPPMMLLRNKLPQPKIGEPRQEGRTGLPEAEAEAEILSGLLVVVATPIGLLVVAATPIGALKLVIPTGPPPPPLPLRMSKSPPIQSGLIAVPGTVKRKSQTIR